MELIENPFNVLQYELIGECNRCGDCCRMTILGELYECENLKVEEDKTTCLRYEDRSTNPKNVKLMCDTKSIEVTCLKKGTDLEKWAIIHRIQDGRKCSYEIKTQD